MCATLSRSMQLLRELWNTTDSVSYSLQVFFEYQIVEIEKKKIGKLCSSSPYMPYLSLGKEKQRQMKDQGQEICEVLKCIV